MMRPAAKNTVPAHSSRWARFQLTLVLLCVLSTSLTLTHQSAQAQTSTAEPGVEQGTPHGAESQLSIERRQVSFPLDDKTSNGLTSDSIAFLPSSAQDVMRPAVLLVHEWWGLNDYAISRAEELAAAGYIVLAVDLYGDGQTTTDPQVAGTWAGVLYNDRAMWRDRLKRGLEQLEALPNVDTQEMAAIGFCFGGTAVIELAYAGAQIDGIVSFHGNPLVPLANDRGSAVNASLLLLHGAADPFVPQDTIDDFTAAADAAGLDWQLVTYAGAQHAFTNPAADDIGLDGVAYDESAAVRSWRHMDLFFDEIFAD